MHVALRNAARDADSKTGSRQVAEQLYRDERTLFESFIDQWVIEKLASIIGKHRARMRREANEQLMFEESLGFKRLPRTIEVAPGERIARANATIGVFRRLAVQLRNTESPALAEANRAIELMSKYTAGHPRITWAKVLKEENPKKQ